MPTNPSQSIPTHTAIEANRAMRNRTYKPIPSQNHIPTILNIPISSTHQPLNHPHLTPSPHTPQPTPINPNQPQPPQPQEECSTVYSQQCPPAYSAPRHQKHPNIFNTNQKLNSTSATFHSLCLHPLSKINRTLRVMVLQFITFKQLLHRAEMVRPHNNFSSFFGSISLTFYIIAVSICQVLHLLQAAKIVCEHFCTLHVLHVFTFHFECLLSYRTVFFFKFFSFQVVPLFKAAKLCD